jgi:hypothetical protein
VTALQSIHTRENARAATRNPDRARHGLFTDHRRRFARRTRVHQRAKHRNSRSRFAPSATPRRLDRRSSIRRSAGTGGNRRDHSPDQPAPGSGAPAEPSPRIPPLEHRDSASCPGSMEHPAVTSRYAPPSGCGSNPPRRTQSYRLSRRARRFYKFFTNSIRPPCPTTLSMPL